MIVYTDPQGSEAWHEARRGVITASRFKDCRDYNQPTAAEKAKGVTRGKPSKKLLDYAMDVARGRVGGVPAKGFSTWQMGVGIAEEPFGRMAYEERTGLIVQEAGFITTDDRLFGCSVDGFVGDDGIFECKTMVSSATLFQAVVNGDISEFIDQCNGELWLLGRKWVDLVLWAPDLEHCGLGLTIVRIDRDDDAIHDLETDLMAFAAMVDQFETALRRKAA